MKKSIDFRKPVFEFQNFITENNINLSIVIFCIIMFIIAVVFVFIAISAPTLGKTIYIGDYKFGAEQWRTCYKIYAVAMVGLFVASFFIKKNK